MLNTATTSGLMCNPTEVILVAILIFCQREGFKVAMHGPERPDLIST